MPDMGECDAEVYRNGELIGIVAGIGADYIESLIVCVRNNSGQRVDWHYAGGRAIVKAIGNIDAVKKEFLKIKDIKICSCEEF